MSSDNVLQFPTKPAEEETQWASGEARCFQCEHTWVAVAPVGTVQLECPNCHTMKGLWKFPFAPSADTLIRVCNCGNDLFRMTPEGHMCANCGLYQLYD
jgi:hypothetical protein